MQRNDNDTPMINVQIISNDLNLSSAITCIIGDDIDYDKARNVGVDFKKRTFEIDNQNFSVTMFANYDYGSPNNGLIFLREEDLDHPPVRWDENSGSLVVPTPSLGPEGSRNVNAAVFLGVVVGLNLSDKSEERAQDYAKKNQLLYAASVNLHDNTRVESIAAKAFMAQFLHQKSIKQYPDYLDTFGTLLKQQKVYSLELYSVLPKILEKNTAYARGAGAGFFKGLLPQDVGRIIGSYLDRGTAGRLARGNKSAAIAAKAEEESDKKPKP